MPTKMVLVDSVIVLSFLLATISGTANGQSRDLSKNAIFEEVQKLDNEIQAAQENFKLLNKKFYYDKRDLFAKWMHQGREKEAMDMLNTAQFMTLIEAIKYSVVVKTLGMTRQMLGAQFIPFENGMVDTGAGVMIRAEMITALTSRAIARAYIEAERQSESTWYMLHKIIEHNLNSHKDPQFHQLASNAYRELLRLRSKGRNMQERFLEILKQKLQETDIDPAQSKPIVDGFDLLIETAVGCPSCSKQYPAAEYLNTRPLFESREAVGQTMSEIIDQEFMDSFETFENESNVYMPSQQDQDKVNRLDINNLMERVIGGGKPAKRNKASRH